MSEQGRPKPTQELRRWFNLAYLKVAVLELKIEEGIKERDFFNLTLELFDWHKYSDPAKAKADKLGLESCRDQYIKTAQAMILEKELIERQIELSGICRQCSGKGSITSKSTGPISQSENKCSLCNGTGWKV